MANDDGAAQFVSGNERLARILADPERCAHVDAIVSEMDQIDRRHQQAVEVLSRAVVEATDASGTRVGAEALRALQRHLRAAGMRNVGITLTFGDHEVTVPLERVAAAPDR